MKWYFQSCLADNNGKSKEIWISKKKKIKCYLKFNQLTLEEEMSKT